MANAYRLQPNEAVLFKDERVKHGGTWAGYSDELILTNLNLVVVKKGAFGGSKGTLTFPLSQIKVHNQQAQASAKKISANYWAVEVYLLNGEETFHLSSGGQKRANEWVAKINEAVTGVSTPVQPGARAIPGAEAVAGVLKDTIGVFKSKLGTAPAAPSKVSTKCTACGAPVSGTQGQAVTCEYCSSVQTL
ncbi:hypothetical protein [Microbacterium sp.]|uniref:hypothetical protein n=1 Tax=Microbacterium sp. TaxID=51671 RepID=UPI0039E3AE7A